MTGCHSGGIGGIGESEIGGKEIEPGGLEIDLVSAAAGEPGLHQRYLLFQLNAEAADMVELCRGGRLGGGGDGGGERGDGGGGLGGCGLGGGLD